MILKTGAVFALVEMRDNSGKLASKLNLYLVVTTSYNILLTLARLECLASGPPSPFEWVWE